MYHFFQPKPELYADAEFDCFFELFLRTLSLTLGEIVGHAILLEPSLIRLSSSYTATLWLLDADDLETCSNNIHAP